MDDTSTTLRALVRISFDASAPEEAVRQLEQLLSRDRTCAVILDFSGIERLDVRCLRALARVAEFGSGSERVRIDRIAPEAYKAMHLAGLAGCLRRASDEANSPATH